MLIYGLFSLCSLSGQPSTCLQAGKNKYCILIDLYYLVLVPLIFDLNLLIAFCTVHVLSCVLVKIFGHISDTCNLCHYPEVYAKTSLYIAVLAEAICHTFPIHVSIDLFGADVQFIVLIEVIYHTITLHVLISSTNTLPYNHIKPKLKLNKF